MNSIHRRFSSQGLTRPRDTKLIAGVCAGVGRRFNLGPWVVRVLFILSMIVIPGSQFLIYPVLWILMPAERPIQDRPSYGTPPRA